MQINTLLSGRSCISGKSLWYGSMAFYLIKYVNINNSKYKTNQDINMQSLPATPVTTWGQEEEAVSANQRAVCVCA